MRRVIVPALLVVAMAAINAPNASAFGLFDKLCGGGCDSCCDVEPACGCEIAEPACGCEIAEPACGCEVVDPCCDSGCGHKKLGLFSKLFKRHSCCDTGCCDVEPACGCEIAAPTCGCEIPAPACGCEVVDPCCQPACEGPIKKLLNKLFHKHRGCDACCDVEPACGCEIAEPACGCEPSCGCGF